MVSCIVTFLCGLEAKVVFKISASQNGKVEHKTNEHHRVRVDDLDNRFGVLGMEFDSGQSSNYRAVHYD